MSPPWPITTNRSISQGPPTHSTPAVNINNLNTLNWLRNNGEYLVLIVFDGTWKHAKEMVKASEEFLSKFATRVCLEIDVKVSGGSIYESELILRKEPFSGCVSTMESLARALRVIEPNGLEIESNLIEILREMVKLQASYLKPMKPMPKLMNKVKGNEKQMEKNEFCRIDYLKRIVYWLLFFSAVLNTGSTPIT